MVSAKSPSKSLYEVLGVERAASQADIKRAYHKLALKLHPDKNPGDEEASAKFQSLQRIYAVLKDPEKRKAYDATGSLKACEGLAGEQFDSLYAFYRDLYKQVTEEDIEAAEDEYRGSEEETADLLRHYSRLRGDMGQVFEWVMCSDPARDSHRFADTIDASIAAGGVKRHKAFTKWAAAVRQRPAPKNPLAKRKKAKGAQTDGGDSALVAAIRNKKGGGMAGLAAALEAKYGAGEPPSEAAEEPSEAEFAAAAARLSARRAAAPAGGGKKRGAAGKQGGGGKAGKKARKAAE